jgi:hypothetical protein
MELNFESSLSAPRAATSRVQILSEMLLSAIPISCTDPQGSSVIPEFQLGYIAMKVMHL